MTLMTQAEYARHIGKSKQYVGKLVTAGKIVLDADKKVDSDVADAALKATADPARAMAEGSTGGDQEPLKAQNSYTEARTKREMLKGNLEEIKIRRIAGELVEAEQIESVLTDIFRDLRERLQGLPTKTKGRLVSMVDEREIQVYLANEVQQLLTDISDTALERLADVRLSQ